MAENQIKRRALEEYPKNGLAIWAVTGFENGTSSFHSFHASAEGAGEEADRINGGSMTEIEVVPLRLRK